MTTADDMFKLASDKWKADEESIPTKTEQLVAFVLKMIEDRAKQGETKLKIKAFSLVLDFQREYGLPNKNTNLIFARAFNAIKSHGFDVEETCSHPEAPPTQLPEYYTIYWNHPPNRFKNV